MPVIGYLGNASPEATAHLVTAFRKATKRNGFAEGQTSPSNSAGRITTTLGFRNWRPILVSSPGGCHHRARQHRSGTCRQSRNRDHSIVFSAGADPVKIGLVASLNRPGSNVTGVSTMNNELVGKQLGFLHEVLPSAVRFAALINSNNPSSEATIMDARAATAAIGRSIEVLTVSSGSEIDAAFASLVQKRVEALLVAPDPLFINRRVQLQSLAMRHAVPAIFSLRENVEAGGLMSYGSSIIDLFRQTGIYVSRILKGEKPSDLPVMQATKFELVINLQTARTLGIEVPPTLLARADEVIE